MSSLLKSGIASSRQLKVKSVNLIKISEDPDPPVHAVIVPELANYRDIVAVTSGVKDTLSLSLQVSADNGTTWASWTDDGCSSGPISLSNTEGILWCESPAFIPMWRLRVEGSITEAFSVTFYMTTPRTGVSSSTF